MSLSDALFTLLIGPLKTLFEYIYVIVYHLTENPGFSIIGLSLVMNLLLMPLYNRTDAIQLEAIETEKRLKPYVTHIKKTFKGNEQFMMLQTCYRQNHYKPTDAIKGVSPLLLEIPFFMAAYYYLSGLNLLNGASFGPIADLGAPDRLLAMGSISINVLPILMTIINLVSSMIYTKDAPMKTKVQLYGMAVLFLVLLYNSPSGLVFYWTLNNLFSLIKNIFMKLKKPRLVLGILSSAISAAGLVCILFVHPMDTITKQIFVAAVLLALNLPLLLQWFSGKHHAGKTVLKTQDHVSYLLGCTFLTILIGLLIPSAVIRSSPVDFINIQSLSNPVTYVLGPALLAVGTFIIWLGLFYYLASDSGKNMMNLAVWLVSVICLVDYMFFGTDYGVLSPNLKYDNAPAFPVKDVLINLGVILAVGCVFYLIWKKKKKFTNFVYITVGIAIAGMSTMNLVQANSIASAKLQDLQNIAKQEVSLPLSKNGKNVVIIMMDKAINPYVPYILQENPGLKEKFDGFTHYSNVLSYGPCTNIGAPGLYGGYEYIPEAMNRRDDMLLEDKHNEALKVMPVSFLNQGYEVTVCDPSYAGYSVIPDLTIYDEYPDIHAYNLQGRFVEHTAESNVRIAGRLNQNLFRFSLFKTAPLFAQHFLYADGAYNDVDFMYAQPTDEQMKEEGTGQVQDGMSKATGLDPYFMNNYTVLKNLPNITDIREDGKNTFLMMANELTHAPTLLQEPEYEPRQVVDNTEYDAKHADRFTYDGVTLNMWSPLHYQFYQVNMAALIQLGNWFDYLRENDVYDNTRIIIVADHGAAITQLPEAVFGDRWTDDIWVYTPILLVKDFDGHGFEVDDTFMTNADVPFLAFENLIPNAINPFTKKPISNDLKKEPIQHLFANFDWDLTKNCGYRFTPSDWIAVNIEDITDKSNWTFIEDPSVD